MGRPAAEIAAEDAALIVYGWAPGRYMCKCVMCGESFEGDKRAVMCRPHALAAYEAKVDHGDSLVLPK